LLRAAEHKGVIDFLSWALNAVRQPPDDVVGVVGVYLPHVC
jgi:hypothetical protein